MYNLFDLVVVVVVGLFAFFGLRKGLIEEAIRLIGLVLASFAGVKYYYLGVGLVKSIFSFSEGVQTVIGFILIFLIVYLALQIVSSMLKRIIRSLNLAWVDRTAGLIFGTLKGITIMTIIVWMISVFPELGLEKRLKTISPAYILLLEFKCGIVKTFKVEDELEALRNSLRKLFFLDNHEDINAFAKSKKDG
ncbi:MAG: CvpA family protein [Candidatus Marinimicrobia bacterium]|nr:CvpA family protein [Candidatus Neomarinimicrobiota bacterium]